MLEEADTMAKEEATAATAVQVVAVKARGGAVREEAVRVREVVAVG